MSQADIIALQNVFGTLVLIASVELLNANVLIRDPVGRRLPSHGAKSHQGGRLQSCHDQCDTGPLTKRITFETSDHY